MIIDIFKITFIASIMMALSACQTAGTKVNTEECDPNKGGFASGLKGIMSGCYEKRVEQKEAKLSNAKSLTEQLNDENSSLNKEKSESSAKLEELQHKISRIQSSNAQLANSLAKMKATNAAKGIEKIALEKRLLSLNNSLDNAKTSTGNETDLAKRVSELQKLRDQLADDISEAMME